MTTIDKDKPYFVSNAIKLEQVLETLNHRFKKEQINREKTDLHELTEQRRIDKSF